MAWSCGIVGMPNAGKSTLFKALTNLNVTIESYPFSTLDPNKAVVPIPDQRLAALAELNKSEKVTPATIEIIDVAGLVEGASRGEGLGNQFLGHLRTVNLLVHVLAGFNAAAEDPKELSAHLDIVNLELGLADLEVLARRRQKLEPKLRLGEKAACFEVDLLSRLEDYLNRGLPLREFDYTPEEGEILSALSLLTLKEMIYVLNLSEENISKPDLSVFPVTSKVVTLCARLEAELSDLPLVEREAFFEAYGFQESQAEKLLGECYNLLKLITFYTIKGSEAKAWVVPVGIKAVDAAGKIHTDIEQGFINVEVVPWVSLLNEGGLAGAREKGLCKTEGREYCVQDGDVLYFRFRQ